MYIFQIASLKHTYNSFSTANNNLTLVKSQLLNFHVSLGTQEHQIIKMTLLTSHTTVSAPVLPTGRHLLLGTTQVVKSGWQSNTAHLRGFPLFFQCFWLISVFNNLLYFLYKPGLQTGDSITHLNYYSFKYLLTWKYYLNN